VLSPICFVTQDVPFYAMRKDNPLPCKLLVRHVVLNKFLSPAGRWVIRAEAAFNFPNTLNAINTCLGRGLKDVELILRFDGNWPERRIPLAAIE
jgi:hypothetical protein